MANVPNGSPIERGRRPMTYENQRVTLSCASDSWILQDGYQETCTVTDRAFSIAAGAG